MNPQHRVEISEYDKHGEMGTSCHNLFPSLGGAVTGNGRRFDICPRSEISKGVGITPVENFKWQIKRGPIEIGPRFGVTAAVLLGRLFSEVLSSTLACFPLIPEEQ